MNRIIIATTFLVICILANQLTASVESIGVNGINSINLSLTGQDIDIGQVENGRPGDEDIDSDPGSTGLYHTEVNPADVFRRHPQNLHFIANANFGPEVSVHAVQVAGIIISTDQTAKGVAPEANLFSVGVAPTTGSTQQDLYEHTAISAQHIATLQGQDLRGINVSLALGPGTANPNGSSTLSQFIDWSTSEHKVL